VFYIFRIRAPVSAGLLIGVLVGSECFISCCLGHPTYVGRPSCFPRVLFWQPSFNLQQWYTFRRLSGTVVGTVSAH